MNDLYGAFATAALDNYIQKADPRKYFAVNSADSTDPESQRSSLSKSLSNVKEKLFNGSQSKEQAPEQPPSVVPSFILSKMSDRADYTKAVVAFAACALFLLLAVFSLPTIIFAPQKFTLLFTLAVLSLVFGLAFLQGPQAYLRKLTDSRKNLVASAVLTGSMVLSLYFSIVAESYLMSLLLCFVELNAVLLFFCNTFPAAQLPMLRAMGGAASTVVTAPFRR